MRCVLSTLLGWVWLVAVSRQMDAQDWPNLIAQGVYVPTTEQELERSRTEAVAAMEQVESRMRHEANGASWLTFLKLDELRNALTKPKTVRELSDSVDSDSGTAPQDSLEIGELPAIKQTSQRLIGVHVGLEMRELLELRKKLAAHVRVRSHASQGTKSQDAFLVRLQAVRDLISNRQGSLDAEAYRELAPHVAWFKDHQQAAELTSALASVSHPNVVVEITDQALALITKEPVYKVKPISEPGVERSISGQAILAGSLFLRPVPSKILGECRVDFKGSVCTRLNGSQGPISFGLTGTTVMEASKTVFFGADRFRVLPAQAQANTNLRTDQVCSPYRGVVGKIVRRAATQEIAKEQPQESQRINQEAKEEFLEEFNEMVQKEISELDVAFHQEVLTPLVRLDLRPKRIEFQAHARRLQLLALIDAGQGMGAPGHPPLADRAHDIALHLHESMINRIAGRMFSNEQVDDFSKRLAAMGIKLPEDQSQVIPKNLKITFATDHPLSVRFDKDLIELRIAGAGYVVDNVKLVAMNILIRYRIENQGSRILLRMVDKPEVVPPKKPSLRFLAQRNVLVGKLEKELPKQFAVNVPVLPKPADKLGGLQFTGVESRDGWLNVQMLGQAQARSDPQSLGLPSESCHCELPAYQYPKNQGILNAPGVAGLTSMGGNGILNAITRMGKANL